MRARRREIEFNRPFLTGNEHAYVREAIEGGALAGDGPFTARCRAALEEAITSPCVLLTTSCTHALEMAAILLEIGPGDEIVVPSFAFSSTANAFVSRGARAVFVDVRSDTFNLDEGLLERALTPRTKAIVVLHYGGTACAMDAIGAIAASAGVPVVEDNAHGLFGAYQGTPLGRFGVFAAHSFHESKNVTCGEGGALAVNDLAYVSRAEIVREKGTDRARFFRGGVDAYTWRDVGSSYLPSDILAAYLWAQLEARDRIQARRREIWMRYARELLPWAALHDVRLPHVPAGCEPAYHCFSVLVPSQRARDALLAHHRDHGVRSTFHYQPLHLSPMGLRFGARRGDCPVTESVAERLVRLPIYAGLSDDEQSHIIAVTETFRPDR